MKSSRNNMIYPAPCLQACKQGAGPAPSETGVSRGVAFFYGFAIMALLTLLFILNPAHNKLWAG